MHMRWAKECAAFLIRSSTFSSANSFWNELNQVKSTELLEPELICKIRDGNNERKYCPALNKHSVKKMEGKRTLLRDKKKRPGTFAAECYRH